MNNEKLELPTPMPFNLKIPLLKPYWNHKEFLRVFKSITGHHIETEVIENLVRTMFHSKYAIATNKGRTAGYLGMRALGLSEGDEIICPSFFCRTLTQAILQLGCIPVYADIDEDLNVSPESIRRCISKKVKAIIMPHMFGKLARIGEILKIAKEHNLFVLDDAAVAVGAIHDRKFAGTLGDIGIISFNIGKQMNATGGGILLTEQDRVYEFTLKERLSFRPREEQVKQIVYAIVYYYFKKYSAPLIAAKRILKTSSIPASYRKYDGIPEELKGNSRIPEEFRRLDRSILFNQIIPSEMNRVESLMAFVQLNKLDTINRKTVKNANLLSMYLQDIKEIDLPKGNYPEHVFSYYTIIVKKGSRYDLAKHLARKGIETQWTFYPLHLQERFSGYRADNLSLTEELWKKVLSLPVGPYLTEKDIKYLTDSIREYFFQRKTVSFSYKEEIKKHHRNLVNIKPGGKYFTTKLNILKDFVKQDFRVLELGCGNGNFSIPISSLAKEIYGIDFTQEMLESFKRNICDDKIKKIKLINADIGQLPFKKSIFDLIYSYSTLYLIRELDKVLKEAYGVIKDKGKAVFELNNQYSIDGLHFKLRFRFFQNFIPLWKIKKLLKEAGFNIIKIRYFQLIPNFLKKGFLQKILDYDMRSKTVEEFISSIPILRFFAFRFIFICIKI